MRYRVLLPRIMGILSAVLAVWDLCNLRFIESKGMAWDTGASFWPYETANWLFAALNAPSILLSYPLARLPYLNRQETQYIVLLPATVLWWWWIGTRLDFGIPGARSYAKPRLWAIVSVFLAVAFGLVAAWLLSDGIEGWLRFPGAPWPVWGDIAVRCLWSLVLAAGFSLAAWRLLKSKVSTSPPLLRDGRAFLCGAGFVLAFTLSGIAMAMQPQKKPDPNSCAIRKGQGCIHGTVTDSNGSAIRGMMVELLPASGRHAWTDSLGRYSFEGLAPGG